MGSADACGLTHSPYTLGPWTPPPSFQAQLDPVMTLGATLPCTYILKMLYVLC
jgi:hypothetical protein